MSRPPAGPQTLLRSLNARAILESLALRGPLTRAELMSETGLSRTAVTQVLRMLEAGEAVASAGMDRETQGPAATRVSLHPSLGYAAAVHIDHHSVHIAVVDPTGAVRAEQRAPLRSAPDLGDRVVRIAEVLHSLGGAVSGPLRVVVVGVVGVVTPDGTLRDDQGPDGGAFRSALSARLACPVILENDVNLAALAELAAEDADRLGTFALLSLDDGLGAGIVIDGALHRGTSGLAGEIMYLPQPNLPVAAPVLSSEVIADLALANERDPDAPLDDHLRAAEDGDVSARAMLDEMAARIVRVAGAITLVLDPAEFILAGRLAHPVFVAAVEQRALDIAHLLRLSFRVSAFGREAALVGAVGQAAARLRELAFGEIVAPLDRAGR